ncbi:hypothetical protein BJX68DRAFT_217017 [Aspergillus pseudodeflectus]|uniref:C2H2-type domain-containing protein n=1 Tax=Aspergillus pseudodeflectus TaxID=176178 RepID=A0ABR4KWN4_9EURO
MSPLSQPNNLSPAELLKYLPEYGVVICTACHYAVQPQAISRHLKEIHRILRSHRRKYTAFVAGLSLRQPHDVVPPMNPLDFPVRYLPVEPGFRCKAPNCEYMCVSCKRMEAHWRSGHGTKALAGGNFQPVPLQTFFRGNLLKYFTASESILHKEGHTVSHIEQFPSSKRVLSSKDVALLDHYLQHTAQSFSTDAETDHIWRTVMPTLAHEHSFVLDGLLACAAHHRAYLNPDKAELKQEYILRAWAYQDAALPEFRIAIENVSEANCDAIIVFAYLLVVYSFADSRHESRSLGINDVSESNGNPPALFFLSRDEKNRLQPDSILPNWLYLLRGGCSMICDVWEYIQIGPVRALTTAWEIDLEGPDERDPEILARLLKVIPTPPVSCTSTVDEATYNADIWSHEVEAVYTTAAIQLSRSFAYLRKTYPDASQITTWDILRVWPMEVSMEYMALLQQEHPGALILLAHYCVLLRYMERYWYFEGKAGALLKVIRGRLGERWRSSLEWPVGVVLGDK